MKTQYRHKADASPRSEVYTAFLQHLTATIAPLQELHQRAVEVQAPIVRSILRGGCTDSRLIEHTLDQLLDHACIPEGLGLFKSLCRHYWPINPHATASYVNAYREMWDSPEPQTQILPPQP